jgi:hypothetical protein
MLERLRNPPEAPIQLNDPGIRHSISTYLALENASPAANERVIKSTKQNFPDAPGANNCLKFQAVENLITSYTGIEPIEHNMCINSCIGFTGPFSELTKCPRCGKTRWDEVKLEVTNGRIKIPVKRFTTLPLGLQLQAMYRNPKSACDMRYLYERTQQVLDEYEEKNKISIINDITAGWDYLGSSLTGDISETMLLLWPPSMVPNYTKTRIQIAGCTSGSSSILLRTSATIRHMYYLVDSFLAPKNPKLLIHSWSLVYIMFRHYRLKVSRSGTRLVKKLFALMYSSFSQLWMVLDWYIGMASSVIVA